jgi:Na+/melibiose symporter-like transporter
MSKVSLKNIEKVKLKPKLFLGIGFFAMFFANQSVPVLAIPFYQMTLGVDPFLLGLSLTIPIMLSTILGPWVGHLTDSCQSKYGRRKPFILIASWVSCFTFGLIWMVSPNWSESSQLLYFTACSLVFYIAVIFLSVPMTSLSFEMTDDHHERTDIMGFTTYFIKIGTLLYQWLFPLAQLAIFSSVFIGIQYIGWGVAIFIIGLLGTIPAIFCKEKQQRNCHFSKQPRLMESLNTLKQNKPLKILLVLTALQFCGGAFTASMDYYLIVYSLNGGDIVQGSIWKGVLSTAFAVAGIIAIPMISKLSLSTGKIKALTFIYCLNAIGGIAKWFIYTPGTYWLLIFDALLCAAIWSAMTMLIPSMLADLCDEDELLHQQRREGLFVSIHTWVVNISLALSLLISGLLLNSIGFNANNQAFQTDDSIFLMRIILSFGTVIFSLIPLLLLRHYTVDAKKCLETRKLLEKQQEQNI